MNNDTEQVITNLQENNIEKNNEIPVVQEELKSIVEQGICTTLDDFNGSQINNWVVVNDGVMGGLSQGNINIKNNTLIFSGNINTNGGGFSSIRSRVKSGLFENIDYIGILAKSDTRTYTVTFRDDNTRGISYQYDLEFKNIGVFEEIIVPLNELKPTYFGRNIQAPDFQKQSTQEIGFILSDGIDGMFQLEIDSINLCKKSL